MRGPCVFLGCLSEAGAYAVLSGCKVGGQVGRASHPFPILPWEAGALCAGNTAYRGFCVPQAGKDLTCYSQVWKWKVFPN